jgi:hypothetical protein
MDTRVSVTESELLDALALTVPGDGPEDARTVAEMVQATGIYIRRIRHALARLQQEGRLTVHQVVRRDLAGRRSVVPAYTITPKPSTTKAARRR